MVRIRRFGVVKTATVAAVMYALIILVVTLAIGLPIALLAGAAGMRHDAGTAAGLAGVGVVGVLLFGVLGAIGYGIGGWIMTAIACLFYNVVAGWVGGIEVELQSVAPPPGSAWSGPYGGYPQAAYLQGGYAQPGYAQPASQQGPGYPPQYPPSAAG